MLFRRVLQKNNLKFQIIIVLATFILAIISVFTLQNKTYQASASGNLSASNYYVDGEVLTSGDGSLANPFKTISECAAIAKPGDTCNIKGGIYREQISPINSGTAENPINFKNYDNQQVLVTGTRKIVENQDGNGSWQNHSGDIWKIQLGYSQPIGQNQVFVNDQVQLDARWPNMPNSAKLLKRQDYAISEAGSLISSAGSLKTGSYSHPQMPTWANGAKMSFTPGKEWWGFTGQVVSQNNQQINFTYTIQDQWLANGTPSSNDPFMLWGKLEALDDQKEFFIDVDGDYGVPQTLYIYGNPAGKIVEIKTRQQVLDLANKSHIRVSGLNFKSGSISTNHNSSGIILDSIDLKFASYNMWTGLHKPAILLHGNNNQVINSDISVTGGVGLEIDGQGAVIKNNTFSYLGYNIQAQDGIQTIDTNSTVIENNTIFAGKSLGISFSGMQNSQVKNNHVFGIGHQNTDIAGINSWNGGDGVGTSVSYNLVHDIIAYANSVGQHNGGAGIRLDSGGAPNGNCNYNIYNNLVFDTTKAGIGIWGMSDSQLQNCNTSNFNNNDNNNNIYNNTVDGFILLDFEDLTGTELKNNLLTQHYSGTLAGVEVENTTFNASMVNFVDTYTKDYRLRQTSPAIDSGIQILPFTDGFLGSNPDRGAFEDGASAWLAGATIFKENLQSLSVSCDASSKLCDISNLPAGRKLPNDFKILLGGSDRLAGCSHTTNNIDSGDISASCKIDIQGLTGTQSLEIQIGTSSPVNKGNLNLDSQLQITSISPSSGSFAGGNTLTINGQNFKNTSETVYAKDIKISNSSAQDLYDYQMAITLDTQSLILEGKLNSDCSNLIFKDSQGQLNYWLDFEKQCNQTDTVIWVLVPKIAMGQSQIEVNYGFSNLDSSSNCQNTFIFCDEFEDANVPEFYDLIDTNDGNGLVLVEENGQIKISGQNNNKKYNTSGFRANWRLPLPQTPYVFDADINFANLGTANNWKASLGGYENSLAVYNGGTDIGYYNGGVIDHGDSSLGSSPSGWQTIGLGFNPQTNTLYHVENNQILATRSQYTNPVDHRWGFAPQKDGVSWDFRVDNLRIRNFSPDGIEPTIISIQNEIQTNNLKVNIGDQECLELNYISSNQITCKAPVYTGNQTASTPVNVELINPDGESTSLANGYTYLNEQNPSSVNSSTQQQTSTSTTSQRSLDVDAESLSIDFPETTNFEEVAITKNPSFSVASIDDITVEDARGSLLGWNLNVAIDNLSLVDQNNNPIPEVDQNILMGDAVDTIADGAYGGNQLITITTGNLTTISGKSHVNALNLQSNLTFDTLSSLDHTGQTGSMLVLKAPTQEGVGKYSFSLFLSIQIPANGNYNIQGQNKTVKAGSYQGKLTFDLI